MSRSYKKSPYVTDHRRKSSKINKRLANKRFRRIIARTEDTPCGSAYKKYIESWNICDYRWRMTREDAIHWYENEMEHDASSYFKEHYPTLKDWLKYWEKCYRRK